MTHAPRHMAHRTKRVSLTTDVTVRRAVSAGMTVAIPSMGAVVVAAPSMAAPDSSSSAAPLTDATPAVSVAHATVMYGSRGSDVRALQAAVGVTPDGAFGPLTLAAVKAYQKSHGLVADGIVGPLTWAVVNGATPAASTTSPATAPVAKPAATIPTQTPAVQKPAVTTPATPAVTQTPTVTTPATPTTAKPAAPKTIWVGSTDAAVKVLQSKLGVTITGVFTNDLTTSVKAYQSAHGLVADGVVGPLTWGQIGVSASDVTTLAPTLSIATPVKPAVTTPVVTTPVVTPAVVTPAATPATTPVVTVSSTTSTPQAASASAQQIIDYAKTFLGVPYVWGGNTPSGFDCSGLTSYVFAHFGYTIPRVSQDQQRYLTPTTNPQPGDLLFYGTPAYHVAIYLGDGMMLAAPHPGGVVEIRTIYGTPSSYARVINH